MNKSKICKENGYHTWQDFGKSYHIHFESSSESFEDIEGTLTCQICGATAELSGDWEVEDDDEEE